MSKLTQAEMEAKYDAERNGTAYAKDVAISPAEETALDILLRRQLDAEIIAILEQIDGGESESETAPSGKRFCDAIDRMFDLPDAQRLRAVVMLESFFASETLDQRFDRAVDNLADLPEARRAAGVSLVEAFLAGAAA